MGDESEILARLDRIERALALLRHPLPPQTLRVSQAAELLQVSERTVRNLIASGELPASAIHCGERRLYRIEQSALAEYLKASRPFERGKNPPRGLGGLLKIPNIKI